MEYDIKIEGHVVYYELEDGKVRAMVVFDGFEDKAEAFHYVNSVIQSDEILEIKIPPYATIH